MEDKFGYLMDEEAEQYLIDQFRDLKNSIFKFFEFSNCELEAFSVQEKTLLSCGGRHSKDKTIYKIR